MILPTIRRNSPHARTLLQNSQDADRKVRAASDALASIEPAARDYYPNGDATFRQAVREHDERVAHLQAVQAELTGLIEHLIGHGG